MSLSFSICPGLSFIFYLSLTELSAGSNDFLLFFFLRNERLSIIEQQSVAAISIQ